MGDGETAATIMCRRGDAMSLYFAALIYMDIEHPNADATVIQCLKLSGTKMDLPMMHRMIRKAENFQWFKAIAITLENVVVGLELVVSPSDKLTQVTPVHAKEYFLNKNSEKMHPLQAVREQLKLEGLLTEECYNKILEELGTKIQPTSPKTFWYLVSIELTKLVLAAFVKPDQAQNCLESLTSLMLDWGRPEHVHNLTHVLFSGDQFNVPECLQDVSMNCPTTDLLKQL